MIQLGSITCLAPVVISNHVCPISYFDSYGYIQLCSIPLNMKKNNKHKSKEFKFNIAITVVVFFSLQVLMLLLFSVCRACSRPNTIPHHEVAVRYQTLVNEPSDPNV